MATILIVDDAPIVRRNLRRILENEGHFVVDEAEDGSEGVDKYKKTQPDLVTMDIQMPVLDGIAAVKQIRVFDPNAKILMISSVEQRAAVIDAVKEGAKNYIVKPFDEEKVVEVVNAVLGKGRVYPPPATTASPQSSAASPAPQKRTQPHAHTQSANVNVSAAASRQPHFDAPAPFELLMKDGRLNVLFSLPVTERNYPAWQALQATLRQIRTLKLALVFEYPALHYHDPFWPGTVQLLTQVKTLGGSVAVVCEDSSQWALLKAKLQTDIYAHTEQILW